MKPNILVAGSPHGTIQIVDLMKGQFNSRSSNEQSNTQITGLVFDDSCSMLFSASNDHFIRKWTVSQTLFEPAVKSYTELEHRVMALDLYSEFLATVQDDGRFVILNTGTMEKILGTDFGLFPGIAPAWDVEFSESGTLLFAVGSSMNARYYWIVNGKQDPEKSYPSYVHVLDATGVLYTVEYVQDSDGPEFVIGGKDGYITLVYMNCQTNCYPYDYKKTVFVKSSVWNIAVHPNGDFITVGTVDGFIYFINESDLTIYEDLTINIGISFKQEKLSAGITSLAISPNGRLLAIGHSKGVSVYGITYD